MLTSNLKLDKIIGIDLSLNGPGFCILTPESCELISLHRTRNSIAKLLKKEGSPFKIFDETNFVSINLIDRQEYVGEYHDKERQKILSAIDFTNLIISYLEPHLQENTIVGMEGVSFGSTGNSLIDISMNTALVRAHIVKKINPDNFFVISPTTIKKFAVKGNAKKSEIYQAFLDKKKEDKRLTEFYNILDTYKDKWKKSSGKVEDPCSDIIDATWIALFIEENLEKLSKEITYKK